MTNLEFTLLWMFQLSTGVNDRDVVGTSREDSCQIDKILATANNRK